MISIGSLTVNSVLDKRAILNNSGIARRLDIGTNWNTLRIGYRVAFTDCGYETTGFQWYVGVMSYPSGNLANGPQGSATSHFVGLRGQISSDWPRASSPAQHYGGTGMLHKACVKVGTTVTESASANSFRKSAVITNRFIEIVEITKGSPNYTIIPIGVNNASGKTNGVTDVADKQTLISAMENPGSMSDVYAQLNAELGTSEGYTSGGNFNIAVDEVTNGDLNSIVVTWNRTLVPMILSEVFYNKIA